MMAEIITRSELKHLLEQQPEDLHLIEVLPPKLYEKSHLPGAVNIPLDAMFEERIQEQVPEKEDRIVVYCANNDCTKSPQAAQKLEQMGYENVFDYEGGKVDWKKSGLSTVAGHQVES